MRFINNIKYLFLVFIVLSCDNSEDDSISTLQFYLNNKTFETGAVIACAARDKDTGDILTFYYPKEGALNARYYETVNTAVDGSDFSNYRQVVLQNEPVFNGYLRKFIQKSSNEKWMIVTFEMNGEIKVSNPIRSKQNSKPTVWNDKVTIDQSKSGMPKFTWEDNSVGDNAIYFQVVSDDQDNLISGTYTYQNHFQYYNISNVVLNVTTIPPLPLINGNNYNFTLMDVSEDNWVNRVVIKSFKSE